MPHYHAYRLASLPHQLACLSPLLPHTCATLQTTMVEPTSGNIVLGIIAAA